MYIYSYANKSAKVTRSLDSEFLFCQYFVGRKILRYKSHQLKNSEASSSNLYCNKVELCLQGSANNYQSSEKKKNVYLNRDNTN